MYRQRKTPGTQRRTGLTMAYEEQGTRRSQVAKRKRLWYECVYPQWELFIYKCVQFACNGSIEGYSVPDVICPWFGSLSHPLPLPSSPPTPPTSSSALSSLSLLLLLMAAKDTQITVKLKTLKGVFSWMIWNMPAWCFLSEEICAEPVLSSSWVDHAFPPNATVFAKPKACRC